MDDPWAVESVPEDDDAVALAVDWAQRSPLPLPVRGGGATVEDAFGAGPKVAVRLRVEGSYRGGLFGIPEDRVGQDAWIDVNTISHVAHGRVARSWSVSDRFGLRNRLKE